MTFLASLHDPLLYATPAFALFMALELMSLRLLDDDEAGAIVHERRGKHGRDERCTYCAGDGRHVLASLRTHGLAKRKRGDGWVDPQARARRLARLSAPASDPLDDIGF